MHPRVVASLSGIFRPRTLPASQWQRRLSCHGTPRLSPLSVLLLPGQHRHHTSVSDDGTNACTSYVVVSLSGTFRLHTLPASQWQRRSSYIISYLVHPNVFLSLLSLLGQHRHHSGVRSNEASPVIGAVVTPTGSSGSGRAGGGAIAGFGGQGGSPAVSGGRGPSVSSHHSSGGGRYCASTCPEFVAYTSHRHYWF